MRGQCLRLFFHRIARKSMEQEPRKKLEAWSPSWVLEFWKFFRKFTFPIKEYLPLPSFTKIDRTGANTIFYTTAAILDFEILKIRVSHRKIPAAIEFHKNRSLRGWHSIFGQGSHLEFYNFVNLTINLSFNRKMSSKTDFHKNRLSRGRDGI